MEKKKLTKHGDDSNYFASTKFIPFPIADHGVDGQRKALPAVILCGSGWEYKDAEVLRWLGR